MANRTEATNGAAGADKKAPAETTPTPAPAAPKSSGGLKAFIPLLANIVVMPALAFAVAHFYLLPRLTASKQEAVAAARVSTPESQGKAKENKPKVTAPLGGKILVNVAGTAGTRYLLANMTLVSTAPELKTLVEGHDAQLRDAAAAILAAKTIADLEKPGVRNLVRTEMISVFNDIFGKSVVNEIYLTEFAIQ
jgi:flagellar protein FliL